MKKITIFLKIFIFLISLIFSFNFLIKNFVYNNKLFFENININDFIFNNYGLKSSYYYFLEKRFEKKLINKIIFLENTEKEMFYDYLNYSIPKNSYFFKKLFFNIFMLDALTTYKGWRHFKGLPVRGQRTWTNAWSSYKSNNILRQFRFKNSKNFYSKTPQKESNLSYKAEYVNFFWKLQWMNEWLSAKSSRFKFKGHPSSLKIDIYSMSNYQVMHPLKLKSLSKKQKQSFKKNYFSLGFDPGFTKLLLKNIFDSDKKSKNKFSVVLRDERLNKKKK